MERWLKELLNISHHVINLKKEAHDSTRKIKINKRKDSRNRHDIRAKERVDKLPKSPTL
jgi:hypothetical protein|tara:strand:- start:176 stop:352 length:177 start_codon:yes stop_codon:yes gene_type:complete